MKLKQPLSYYTDDTSLRFYLLSVGEGLMTLIVFPDNKVMLFDCNVTADNEDKILNYLNENIPTVHNEVTDKDEKTIHVFVNSHRDEDHYRGLKKVNEKFPVLTIWDSGQTGATTGSDDYQYYMRLRRKLKDENEINLKVLTPSDRPLVNMSGVNIFCFSSSEEYSEGFENGETIFEAQAKIQHTNSIVLQICYGEQKILLTGDSDWKSWK